MSLRKNITQFYVTQNCETERGNTNKKEVNLMLQK